MPFFDQIIRIARLTNTLPLLPIVILPKRQQTVWRIRERGTLERTHS